MEMLKILLAIPILSLFVFGITLIINKSILFECKREFIEKRYKLAVSQGSRSFLHWLWYKLWFCSMCLGFWVSLIGILFLKVECGFISHIFIVFGAFGINWILHCIETYLVEKSKPLTNNDLEEIQK